MELPSPTLSPPPSISPLKHEDLEVTDISASISYLMQEVLERKQTYGKYFCWTMFDFILLQEKIDQIGEKITELHIPEISKIWGKTLGPLSKVTRPTKTLERANPIIESFDVEETTREIAKVLGNISIPTAHSTNPYFSKLGVMIIPDDFFDKEALAARSCPTLITQSEFKERDIFLKSKVTLKLSDPEFFKTKLHEYISKILFIKGGYNLLEKFIQGYGAKKLPLIFHGESSYHDGSSDSISLTEKNDYTYFYIINSNVYHYMRPIYIDLIHELQHCCLQQNIDSRGHFAPTHFSLDGITEARDLFTNLSEEDAIMTENQHRSFYPKRILHCGDFCTISFKKPSATLIDPVYSDLITINISEINSLEACLSIMRAIKCLWLFSLYPRFKLLLLVAEKRGKFQMVTDIKKQRKSTYVVLIDNYYRLYNLYLEIFPECSVSGIELDLIECIKKQSLQKSKKQSLQKRKKLGFTRSIQLYLARTWRARSNFDNKMRIARTRHVWNKSEISSMLNIEERDLALNQEHKRSVEEMDHIKKEEKDAYKVFDKLKAVL